MIFLYLFGSLVFIVLQCVFVASEIAFISSSLIKVRSLRDKNKNSQFAYRLMLKPERFLATALVGTNISVVVSTVLATSLLINLGVTHSNIWITCLYTPLIVIFAELVPKNVGRYYREELGIAIAQFYRVLEIILAPLVDIIEIVSLWLVRRIVGKTRKRSFFVRKEEIMVLIKEIEREGILERGEKEAIEDVFDFGETRLKEVCVLLPRITGIDYTDSRERILEIARDRGFTRYPVFRNKEIVGYLNIFDLFYEEEKDWHAHIRPITHVGSNQKLYGVFTTLKYKKENIAVVMKGRKALGIVTMEDLIGEILSSIAK